MLQSPALRQPGAHTRPVAQYWLLGQSVFARHPGRQTGDGMPSQIRPGPQAVSSRQPVWHVELAGSQMWSVPHCMSLRHPARQESPSQICPIAQPGSERHPDWQAMLTQMLPVPHAGSDRQPVMQSRVEGSQMRPVPQSPSCRHPGWQLFEPRSQYEPSGQGQWLGRLLHMPCEQTCPFRQVTFAHGSVGPASRDWAAASLTPASDPGSTVASGLAPGGGWKWGALSHAEAASKKRATRAGFGTSVLRPPVSKLPYDKWLRRIRRAEAYDLRVRTLLPLALLLAACGGGGQTEMIGLHPGRPDASTASPTADASVGQDAGPSGQMDTGVDPCAACHMGQICSNSVCMDVPAHCPCPVESYCDLSSDSCKAGCLDDSQCSTGRICDSSVRQCKAGCRADSACGQNQICDAASSTCRAGCRGDNACPMGQICDNTTCRAGCRGDAQCGPGQLCDNTTCRQGCRHDSDCAASGMICDATSMTCRGGCRSNTDCPLEQICSPSSTCTPGCDTDMRCNAGRICEMQSCRDGCRMTASCPVDQFCDPMMLTCKTGCPQGDPSHCAIGKACVNYVDGTNACSAGCYGTYTCNDSSWECFMAIANDTITMEEEQAARCRKRCSSNSDCPMGYICTWFATDSTAPNFGNAQLCAQPCTTTDYCAGTVQDTINPVGTCGCTADGTCHVNGPMTSICYIVDGSAGI
jgi:hypothetical protein